eukprot:GDKI01018900.1.p1 GENE.GDKI01018900.1~~GDKI01018900.1.p1  ORF type:complete len:384 (-),score=67.24 GDKI01018900.1:278-1429(-)
MFACLSHTPFNNGRELRVNIFSYKTMNMCSIIAITISICLFASHVSSTPVPHGPSWCPLPCSSVTEYAHTPDSPPLSCDFFPLSLVSRAAVHESLGWYAENHASWEKRKERKRDQDAVPIVAVNKEIHKTFEAQAKHYLQNNWEPNWACTHEVRMGTSGDGGKWVCDPHKIRAKKRCLVYSFGSAFNFDFETALLTYMGGAGGCEIHVFDPFAIPKPSDVPAGLIFHPWGLSDPGLGGEYPTSAHVPSGAMLGLDQVIRLLHHTHTEIDILKIDIEGYEWRALIPLLFVNNGTLAANGMPLLGPFRLLPLIRQIAIEMHARYLEDAVWLVEEQVTLYGLRRNNYVMFHKEPNIIQLASLNIPEVSNWHVPFDGVCVGRETTAN